MPGSNVTVRDPATGDAFDVPTEQLRAYTDRGFTVEGVEQRGARLASEVRADIYGGVGGALKAGLVGALRGATLGGSDALMRAVGGEEAARELRGLREINPGISTATEIGGALAPAFFSGGAALPAGAVSRIGAGIARAGEGGGALARIGSAAAGGAAEGALFGAGQGVTEAALSEDPLTMEHVASSLGSNMLYGAAIGTGVGALGKAAELGLARAKGAIDDALERRAAKPLTPADAVDAGDLRGISRQQVNDLEKEELARIYAERAPERRALTDELDAWRKANREAHDLREIAGGSVDPNVREASGAFDRANIRLRNALDDRVGFAEDPVRSIRLVRTQGQALEGMRAAADAQRRLWQEAVDTAPQRFRQDIEAISGKATLAERTAEAQARGLVDYTGPFTPAGIENAAERALKEYSSLEWGGAIRNGLKEPALVRRLPAIEQMIESNQRLLARLDDLAKPPTSPRLTKILEAREAMVFPKPAAEPSALGAMASAMAPFAGPLGAAATAGNRVLGSFKKVAAAAAEHAGKAASSFLGAAEKATKVAVPLATRVLASVRYAAADKKREAAEEPTTLPGLFKARTDEIKSQVHIAADGTFQMRPDARAAMAAKFDGIRAADPRAADQLETAGARRIEYLASIIPRFPDYGTVQIGPDHRRVPELAMRSWARSAAAAEDPYGVLDRVAHGTLTPEDVLTMRAVHPEILRAYTGQVTAALPTLRAKLPFERQLTLSMLTGVPVTPAMHPRVIAYLQAQFAGEPGSQGGTQAPLAQPAFGSIKKSIDQPTPAQARSQGVRI
jgi:hypothetical protein